MAVVLSDRAVDSLKDASPPVRRAFTKQLPFLVEDLHHPSLRAKKYDLREISGGQSEPGSAFLLHDVYRIEDVMSHSK
jgi:hypothetical protein